MKTNLIFKKMLIIESVAIFLITSFLSSSICGKVVGNFASITEDQNTTMKNSLKETIKEAIQENQWAMSGHDAQNTRQSMYVADTNPGDEKWEYQIHESLDEQTLVIDSAGVLYISTMSSGLYAIYPNGTQKWHKNLEGFDGKQPALGPDGTIYTATDSILHAFYPNGTLRWKLSLENDYFLGSPLINLEDLIYIGTYEGYIYSIYPNGTIQWKFDLGYPVTSLSSDTMGNLYTSAYELSYLYSLSPNGSVRWTFKLPGGYNFDAPAIGADGTIYVAAWNDLIAIRQDGTEKWRSHTKVLSGSPALTPDGTIILSPWFSSDVIALNPLDGNVKWRYDTGEHGFQFDKSQPAISSDGTIFISYIDFTQVRAFLIALSSNGSLEWSSRLTSNNDSSDYTYVGNPSISEDGTVYVTSDFGPNDIGYIHAFGTCDPNAPKAPSMTGPTQGKTKTPYQYTIQASSPTGKDLYYFIDWGDNDLDQHEDWIGPYPSNQTITLTHTWNISTYYDIRAFAKDTDGLQGTRSGSRITTIVEPTMLFGKISNLSLIENNIYTFNAESVLQIQFFPIHVGFYKNNERFIICHRPHIGLLGEMMIMGRFYAVVPVT